MGRMFTFEMSIRRDHKLVTSGPYGVVRHPGYTGILLVVSGMLLLHASEVSFLLEVVSTAIEFVSSGFLVEGEWCSEDHSDEDVFRTSLWVGYSCHLWTTETDVERGQGVISVSRKRVGRLG